MLYCNRRTLNNLLAWRYARSIWWLQPLRFVLCQEWSFTKLRMRMLRTIMISWSRCLGREHMALGLLWYKIGRVLRSSGPWSWESTLDSELMGCNDHTSSMYSKYVRTSKDSHHTAQRPLHFPSALQKALQVVPVFLHLINIGRSFSFERWALCVQIWFERPI